MGVFYSSHFFPYLILSYQPKCCISTFLTLFPHLRVSFRHALSHMYTQWVYCTLNRKESLSFRGTGNPRPRAICMWYLNTQSLFESHYIVGATNTAKRPQNLSFSGYSQCKWAMMKGKIWLKSPTSWICISHLLSSISIFQFNGWHLLEKNNVMVKAVELNP